MLLDLKARHLGLSPRQDRDRDLQHFHETETRPRRDRDESKMFEIVSQDGDVKIEITTRSEWRTVKILIVARALFVFQFRFHTLLVALCASG